MAQTPSSTSLNPFLARFRKVDFRKSFLVVCMPVHFWAIFMALQDLEWMVGRSHFWEFIGYVAYVLLIAFLESALLSAVFLVAGLLLPKEWRNGINLAVLSAWALVVLLAGIANQYYFFLDVHDKNANPYLVQALEYVHYYDTLVFTTMLILVLLVAILPPLLFSRMAKPRSIMLDLVGRIGLLSTIFLFLDAVGLFIILYRNLSNLILI